MSLNAQAILPGHLTVQEVTDLLAKVTDARSVVAHPRYRPEHWVIEAVLDGGDVIATDVFLNSWAGEDYADAWHGPSTFLSTQMGPHSDKLASGAAAATKGLFRSNERAPWAAGQ